MNECYEPASIESEVQTTWDEQGAFIAREDFSKEKYYCLSMFPYPSGQLHMGHVRNYTLGDVIARYERLRGKNVLQPIGWDAFGLPAENAAMKHKVAPAKWTYANIEDMREQFKRLGLGFDWSRELTTCKPDYYRWEQWLFVRLFKKGLAYRKNAVVNWDPVDQTVLANEQVVDGKGWRSGAPIERREIPQWFLRITAYAEELLTELDNLTAWPEQVVTMQRHWIGRSEGIDIEFDVNDVDMTLTVYSTRPDTLLGTTFLVVAPQHPLAQHAAQNNPALASFIEACQNVQVAEAVMATMEKKGIDTGFTATHPLTQEAVPVWIGNFVLMSYGSGAVMAVPAHDQRDYEFAQQYQLPIKQVIEPVDDSVCDLTTAAYTQKGRLIHSGSFNGLASDMACQHIADTLEKQAKGKRSINYRLRDWGVSRQRYWGAPIPIIYCDDCGAVPVPEKDLPVVLPEHVELGDHGSPLKTMPEFYETVCPECAKPAKRETDTFDTFVESSWYYTRYACKKLDKAMLDDRVKYWTPVDQYVGGVEHAVMHLLYARFFHKVLRDEGLLNSNEPFTRLMTQGMVLNQGAKMSKSKGNTVDPQTLIDRYGADTVRLFIIFAAPPEQALEWSDTGVEGAYRFLKRLWAFAFTHHETIKSFNAAARNSSLVSIDWKNVPSTLRTTRREMNQILKQARYDYERQQFNTVISGSMKLLNLLYALAEIPEGDFTHEKTQLLQKSLSILLRILAPIAPHITQALWQTLGYGDSILTPSWPKIAADALQLSEVTLVVQVNGKLRGKVTVPADADDPTIQAAALAEDSVQSFLEGKSVKKAIVVPQRLINLVVA